MTIEIKVPTLGESVTEATVGQWFKKAGDTVAVDEPLCELETDKVSVEVPAPVAGVLTEISVEEGASVAVGARLGAITEGAGAGEAPAAPPPSAKSQAEPLPSAAPSNGSGGMPASPAARKILDEKGVSPETVEGSGRRGQVLKADALAATSATPRHQSGQPATIHTNAPPARTRVPTQVARSAGFDGGRRTRRAPANEQASARPSPIV